MTRRSVIAAACAMAIVPEGAAARTVEVSSPGTLKLESGVLYRFTAKGDALREVILQFPDRRISMAEYLAMMERISGNKTQVDKPIYLTDDPSQFPEIGREMLDRIRGLRDGDFATDNVTTTISEYFCLILYYTCRTTTG